MLRAMIADLAAPQIPARWQRATQISWGLFTLLALAFFVFEVNFSYNTCLICRQHRKTLPNLV
jgi:hypothetical protein